MEEEEGRNRWGEAKSQSPPLAGILCYPASMADARDAGKELGIGSRFPASKPNVRFDLIMPVLAGRDDCDAKLVQEKCSLSHFLRPPASQLT
jgi:hypothetical protein